MVTVKKLQKYRSVSYKWNFVAQFFVYFQIIPHIVQGTNIRTWFISLSKARSLQVYVRVWAFCTKMEQEIENVMNKRPFQYSTSIMDRWIVRCRCVDDTITLFVLLPYLHLVYFSSWIINLKLTRTYRKRRQGNKLSALENLRGDKVAYAVSKHICKSSKFATTRIKYEIWWENIKNNEGMSNGIHRAKTLMKEMKNRRNEK